MSAMSPSDFRTFSSFLRKLHAWHTVAGLHAMICEELTSLIPGHNVFIGDHDMLHTRVNGCAVTRMFTTPDFLTIVNGCAGEHPLWEPIREGGQEVRVLSDFASRHTWESTRLHSEALGAEGVEDHISIEFGDRSRQIVSVGVFRESRGFSERDRQIMSLLIPHMELALANAQKVERLENALTSSPAGGGGRLHTFRVDLDPDGCPLDLPGKLFAFLETIHGAGVMVSRPWPLDMQAWITSTRGLLDQGTIETRPPPWSVTKGEFRMEARLFRQRHAPGYQLLLRVSRRVLPENPLSRREKEVLYWIGQGKTNEEISIILGVSFFTVKTHVKNIFSKLEVRSRAEAVHRLSGADDFFQEKLTKNKQKITRTGDSPPPGF